jgi:hypothetical protein
MFPGLLYWAGIQKKTWCMRACLLRRVNVELLYRPANFRIPISSTVDRIQDHPVLIGGHPLSPPAYCNASRTFPRSSLCLSVLCVMYVLISQLKPGTIICEKCLLYCCIMGKGKYIFLFLFLFGTPSPPPPTETHSSRQFFRLVHTRCGREGCFQLGKAISF